MKKYKLRAFVNDDLSIAWADRETRRNALASFKGKAIDITIEKHVEKRSNPQNAYFHAAHLPLIHDALVNDCGWDNWTIENTKAFLKDMFLRVEVLHKDGKGSGKFITRGTSDLNTEEFSVFLEQCSLFAWHELKVTIPPASLYKIELPYKQAA